MKTNLNHSNYYQKSNIVTKIVSKKFQIPSTYNNYLTSNFIKRSIY